MCNNLLVATAENDKVLLKIEYDDMNESPREWDNLGTMVCWKRNYILGDDHNYDNNREFMEVLSEELSDIEPERLYSKTDEQLMSIIEKYAVILPIYKYEHSGISLNTKGFSCRWDSGQVGWIYVTKKQVREEYGAKRVSQKLKERIEDYLKGEVDTYSQYVAGEVFGFILEDKETGNEIDSCWGFYGYDFTTNGMAEHLPEEYVHLLKEVG